MYNYSYLANQYSIILQNFSRLLQLHQEERDGWRDWRQRGAETNTVMLGKLDEML